MAEGCAARLEAGFMPRQRPALTRDGLVKLPPAAAVLIRRGHEFTVRVPVGACGVPHGLRLGSDEAIWTVALQLHAAAAVDEAIVRPGLGDHETGGQRLSHGAASHAPRYSRSR